MRTHVYLIFLHACITVLFSSFPLKEINTLPFHQGAASLITCPLVITHG